MIAMTWDTFVEHTLEALLVVAVAGYLVKMWWFDR